jgi:hypothetical protein
MRRLPVLPPARTRPAVRRLTAGLALVAAQVVAVAGAYWWGYTHGSGQHAAGAALGGPGFTNRQQTPSGTASRGAASPMMWAAPRGSLALPSAAQIEAQQSAARQISDTGQEPVSQQTRRKKPEGREAGPDSRFRPFAFPSPIAQPTGSH